MLLVGQRHCQHKPLPLHTDNHGTLKIKEKGKDAYPCLIDGQDRIKGIQEPFRNV